MCAEEQKGASRAGKEARPQGHMGSGAVRGEGLGFPVGGVGGWGAVHLGHRGGLCIL